MAGPFDHLPPTLRGLAEVQVDINAEKDDVERLRERGWIVVRNNEVAVERTAQALNQRIYSDDDWEHCPTGQRDLLLGDARAVLAALAKGGDDAG